MFVYGILLPRYALVYMDYVSVFQKSIQKCIRIAILHKNAVKYVLQHKIIPTSKNQCWISYLKSEFQAPRFTIPKLCIWLSYQANKKPSFITFIIVGCLEKKPTKSNYLWGRGGFNCEKNFRGNHFSQRNNDNKV